MGRKLQNGECLMEGAYAHETEEEHAQSYDQQAQVFVPSDGDKPSKRYRRPDRELSSNSGVCRWQEEVQHANSVRVSFSGPYSHGHPVLLWWQGTRVPFVVCAERGVCVIEVDDGGSIPVGCHVDVAPCPVGL